MSVDQAGFLMVLQDLGVEVYHRGHTLALRFRGLLAYLPIREAGAPVPIKQVRHVIEALLLDKKALGERLPDLFGRPSLPPE